MFREGYLERTIRQLRQAFARLLGKVDQKEDLAALDARLDELYSEHLGISRNLLTSLDLASQLRILGDRLHLAIELLRGERELLAAAGRVSEAAEVGARLEQLESTLDK